MSRSTSLLKSGLSSFYSKLVLGLLASFLLMGFLLALLIQELTSRYQDEITQKLHFDLAKHVVHDDSLLKDGKIDQQALENAFHNMMILGPSFEFYILTPEGHITTYSSVKNKVKLTDVNLEPIQQFLHGATLLPVLGDDPRSQFKQKIFSVAEIRHQDQLIGYLYIIIGGELYDGVVDLLQSSHILTLSFWGLVSASLFSLIVVLFLFAMLTRPLHRLTTDMEAFRKVGFDEGKLPISNWNENSSDEVQRLGSTFNAMAKTLKEQYEKVRTTDEVRRELISYVSHDLRTPLAALQGYLETWQLKHGQLTAEEGEELIQIAVNNAQQVGKLVEQLFELAHLEADNVPINLESVSIAELGQDVLQKLALTAEKKGVSLDVNPKDPSLLVMADIEKMERVLTNLVDNAIRHCKQGDRVDIDITPVGKQLKIAVNDTGIGIAQEDIPHVFEAHYRGSNSAQGARTNSGLGLAITHRIITLHQSEIKVESELGKGASFWFLLEGLG